MGQYITVTLGDAPVGIEIVGKVARLGARVVLSDAAIFSDRVHRSRSALAAALERGEPIYGVTTGFGANCGTRLGVHQVAELGRNLVRYHGCGTGEYFTTAETRAGILCRLACLGRGWSGVSWELLQALAALLNHDITPLVPSEGSVGASGDLTPGSYIAACLQGERDVSYHGDRLPASEALRRAGLEPIVLRPKEALALLNGTSVMTGVAALCVERARFILDAAVAATALCVHALQGHPAHFRAEIFEAKPHPGPADVAARLRALLTSDSFAATTSGAPGDLQDPYSLRCAPHVLGVLADSLRWIERWVETEINSANDNPLVDPDTGEVLMGGNFYGGHIAFAMDALKMALASVADLVDRQVALLIDTRTSRGLPPNLVAAEQSDPDVHHGFKGCQITASALAAEAQKAALPAAVFSRSTESHNQDKVSLGTIAARDAARVCQLTERAVAIQSLAGARGCMLRGGTESRPEIDALLSQIASLAAMDPRDQPLDAAIHTLAQRIGDGGWGGSR